MKLRYFTYWFLLPVFHESTIINIKILALEYQCVKIVQMRSFSGPYFPAFGLNTERYGASLRIQSQCGKIWTRKNSVSGQFSRSVWAISPWLTRPSSTLKIKWKCTHKPCKLIIINKRRWFWKWFLFSNESWLYEHWCNPNIC